MSATASQLLRAATAAIDEELGQLRTERNALRTKVGESENAAGVYEAKWIEAVNERDGLLAEVRELREGLEKIHDHRHCSYDRPDPVEAARNRREYDIGVTDGHRCAATIARAALKGEQDAEA